MCTDPRPTVYVQPLEGGGYEVVPAPDPEGHFWRPTTPEQVAAVIRGFCGTDELDAQLDLPEIFVTVNTSWLGRIRIQLEDLNPTALTEPILPNTLLEAILGVPDLNKPGMREMYNWGVESRERTIEYEAGRTSNQT